MSGASPLRLFRTVAVAEAITWALLLTGMLLKYVTGPANLGEVAVRVFGMVHGVVFIAYGLTTVLVWVDQRWSVGRGIAGLLCAVPPFATVPFDRYAERRDLLGRDWRLVRAEPGSPAERAAAWLLRNPGRGLATGAVAVLVLTGAALLVGPPV